MNKYAMINLKTDPQLKKRAVQVADQLGVSISAVLNNELKRFAEECRVVFEVPEIPNVKTAKQLSVSKTQIRAGNYHRFTDTKKALDFLADELK